MSQAARSAEELREPLVTVVVPAKDDARFLRPCLRSIRDQWFPELECVVVDDGSSDETLEIANEFAAKDARFSVVAHAKSCGPSAARNSGIAASSAPYVTFLDADDFLYPGSIKKRVAALQHSDPAVVAGTFCDWQPTSENQGRTPPDRAPADRKEIVGFVHGPECPFIVTAPIVRRTVLDQVDGFNEHLLTAEDFDLWVRILREGLTFVYVPMIGVAYRQKATGLVFSESAQHAAAAMSVIDRQYEDVTHVDAVPVLSRPLPYYQQQCAQARRLLQTFALAVANGEHSDVDSILQLLPADLELLHRAGLNIESELRTGVWRASRAIPKLRDQAERDRLVDSLSTQLKATGLHNS